MKIKDIIGGTKKRRHRSNRFHRIKGKGIYDKHLSEAANSARIQHIEDLILWSGTQGGKKAIGILRQLESNPQSATIKWDGKPAIIFGRNDKGEFVLTDKSGFGASTYNGRVTNPKDLEAMLVGRKSDDPGRRVYASKMASLWPYFEGGVPEDFRGYVHGDLLYASPPTESKGKVTIKPNTTVYEVDAKSDLGKRMLQSKAGVVIHLMIDLEGNKSKAPQDKFGSTDLFVIPPITVTQAPDIDIPGLEKSEQFLQSNSQNIDKMLDIPAELKMKNFNELMYKYINAKTKAGKLDELGSDFGQWITSQSDISEPKKNRIMQWLQQHEKGLVAIFQFVKQIQKIKNYVINQLDQQDGDVIAYTDGERGHEGYVVDKDYKLVNRDTFTRANSAGNN